MPTITKRVNIKAPVAVRTVNPPIYGSQNNIIMSSGDILKCLCKRAHVEEILPDGSIVKITMSNYFTDNGAGLVASPQPIVKKKAEPKRGMTPKATPKAKVEEKLEVKVEVKPEDKDTIETSAKEEVAVETVSEAVLNEEVVDEVKADENNKSTTVEEVVEENVDDKDDVKDVEEKQSSVAKKTPTQKKNSNKKK